MHILQRYIAYSNAFLEILSIPFLLKTFVSPWKSIADEYPSNLMRYGEIAQTFTLNCTTRIIGMLFRSVALVLALTIQLALLAVFLMYLLLWLAYPGLVVAAIVYFLGLF